MSDGATAAPAAAPAPSNGASPQGGQPAATAPKPNGAPRSTSGQFSPKEGAVGRAPPESPPEGEAPKKEEWRFKEKIKAYGKEEEVDLDREGVKREIQMARAERKRREDAEKRLAERDELDKLFEENPEEYLRRRGKDPEALAKAQILKLVERESMSEEQKAHQDALARAEAAEAKWKKHEEAQKAMREELRMKHTRKQMETRYAQTLAATGMEANAETIYLMAEVDDTAQKMGVEYTPEELGKETARRARGYGKQYLDSLTVQSLIAELGPERWQQMLEHSYAQLTSRAGIPGVATPDSSHEPIVPKPQGQRFLSESEIDARFRALSRKR